MIKVEGLGHSLQYGEELITILEDVNMQVNAGERVAITGQSGSGKTTLLGLVAGLDVPTAGKVTIADTVVTDLSEDQRAAFRAKHVGFVFQSFHLLPSLTALENVSLALSLKGERNAEELAKQYLDQVGLSHRLKHHPGQLSGGEQQRVAIARAFSTQPAYLFADEPTGNLDAETGEKIVALLFDLNKQHGTTLVMVTHDSELAQRCDREFVINKKTLQEYQRTV